jgi:osmotically-inducible protein OsmY
MLVRNKALSINAQNAKIITRNRRVTLRGPARNRAERNKLIKVARHTRGVVRVNNQLEIKAP